MMRGTGSGPRKPPPNQKKMIDVRLRQTEDGRAAGIDHGGARDHVKHAQRDNERLDPKATDQNPVRQSDKKPDPMPATAPRPRP